MYIDALYCDDHHGLSTFLQIISQVLLDFVIINIKAIAGLSQIFGQVTASGSKFTHASRIETENLLLSDSQTSHLKIADRIYFSSDKWTS